MGEWRIGRGWSREELAQRVEALSGLSPNFRASYERMTPDSGWNRYRSSALIATEPPGPPLPGGPFRKMQTAIANYQFSDPSIVIGHFDVGSRLLGRRMLLEMKALRVIRYLGGIVVSEVREEEGPDSSHTFGYRYDTLEGHIERGSEWFILTKGGTSGEIHFTIEAAWLPGDFPNWWSRTGFRLLGPSYQRRWHHEAHRRLFRISHDDLAATPRIDRAGIAHAGPNVEFQRFLRLRAGEPLWENEDETIPTR